VYILHSSKDRCRFLFQCQFSLRKGFGGS